MLPFFTTPVTSRKAFDTDTEDGVQEYPAGSFRIVSHIKVSCYVFVEDRDILFKYQVNLKVALIPILFPMLAPSPLFCCKSSIWHLGMSPKIKSISKQGSPSVPSPQACTRLAPKALQKHNFETLVKFHHKEAPHPQRAFLIEGRLLKTGPTLRAVLL